MICCDDSSEVNVAKRVLSEASGLTANYILHDQPVAVHTMLETGYMRQVPKAGASRCLQLDMLRCTPHRCSPDKRRCVPQG